MRSTKETIAPRRIDPFEHHCHCGEWGAFGVGVFRHRGVAGEWFCFEHVPQHVKDGWK